MVWSAPDFLDDAACTRALERHALGPEYECSTEHLVVVDDERRAFAVRVGLEDFPDIFGRVTQAIDAWAGVTSQLWPSSTEIFRYPRGPGFGWHRDDEFRQGGVVQRARRSFFSFVIFLNDAYQGGELAFESGVHFAPRMGLLVAWPAALRHRVSPVASGERFVLSGANLAS